MTPLDALYRCRRAWERSQPQLFLTDEVLWPDSGLDERDDLAAGKRPADAPHRHVSLVEPAPAYRLTAEARGGLETRLEAGDAGAVSRHDAEGCYPLPDSQLSVGLSGRKDTGSHSDGLAPFPGPPASSRVLKPGVCGVASVENSASYTDANPGAEPRCEQELTATQPLAAPPVSIPPEVGRVGSPNNQTGPDATPAKGARPAQRRSF